MRVTKRLHSTEMRIAVPTWRTDACHRALAWMQVSGRLHSAEMQVIEPLHSAQM